MSRRRAILLGGSALLIVGVLGVWVFRGPIVRNFVDRSLREAGVEARYEIEHLGLNQQRLRDVRIGPAAAPDLTAREIDLRITLGWDGATIQSVRARGVRLRGRVVDGELSLGQLDRLTPDNDEPFELPDYRVDLADAAALIDTPWGQVAAGIEGSGVPKHDFSGSVAVLSASLRSNGCAARQVRARGRLANDGEALRFRGPIAAAALGCVEQDIGLTRPVADMAITVPGSFAAVEWSGNIRADGANVPSATFGRLDGRSEGNWDIADARGAGFGSLRFDDPRHDAIAARGGALTGQFAFAGSQWRASGGAALAGASLRGAAAEYGTQIRAQRGAMLIGPLAEAFGGALDRAGRDFVIAAPFFLRGTAGGVEANVARVSVRSRSGARLEMAGDEPVIGWRRGALSLAGRASLSGGGLPDMNARFARTAGGGFTGVLDSSPYRAGDAALALTALRFAVDRNGSGSFSTALGLSGAFAGGRVDGLAMPISGRIGSWQRLSIDPGCRDLNYRALDISNLSLNAQRLRLCSEAGRPLLAVGPGGVDGALSTGPLRLNGRLGGSPVTLAVAGGRYGLSGAGDFRGFTMAIGTADNAVRMRAGTLSLRSTASGLSGSFADADAQIGPVPLVLDRLQGRWTYANGIFGAEGQLEVSDVQAERAENGAVVLEQGTGLPTGRRFNPMTIPNARLTLANGVIEVAGQMQARATATPVANVRLVHRLSQGTGSAGFAVVPIRFARDGLQPEQLSPLVLGVAANVDGTVTGNGEINWSPDGVTSTGEFSTQNASLAAAFGPVAGMTGTIRFDDLLSLQTPPGQRVSIASINSGIEVIDGEIFYQLLPGQQVRVEGGRWPFAGGTLRLHPALLEFAADRPRHLTFDVEGIDAARFLQRYGFENITATGVFDGVIPTVFDANGGRVVNGGLIVRNGGGTLAYVGELSNRDLGYFGNMAFGALRSVRYDELVIRLNGNIDGEMLTEVSFNGLGQGPGAQNNFLTRRIAQLPFTFNIRINAPFRQLLTSARSLYDPTVLIDQNLPALLREQAAAEARARGEAPPTGPAAEPRVQQPDSGNQP
jgi:translocation and assembly module TamB